MRVKREGDRGEEKHRWSRTERENGVSSFDKLSDIDASSLTGKRVIAPETHLHLTLSLSLFPFVSPSACPLSSFLR